MRLRLTDARSILRRGLRAFALPLLLLAVVPSPAAPQGTPSASAGDATGAAFPAVHGLLHLRAGVAVPFSVAVVSAGAGAEVALNERFGVRGEVGVFTSLTGEGGVVTLTPAAVLFLGEGGPESVQVRAGPFVSLGEAEDIGDGAEVLGPFVGVGVPLGSGPLRFDAVAALLSGGVGVAEAGVAVAFP